MGSHDLTSSPGVCKLRPKGGNPTREENSIQEVLRKNVYKQLYYAGSEVAHCDTVVCEYIFTSGPGMSVRKHGLQDVLYPEGNCKGDQPPQCQPGHKARLGAGPGSPDVSTFQTDPTDLAPPRHRPHTRTVLSTYAHWSHSFLGATSP